MNEKFNEEFDKKIHFFGRLTTFIALILSFSIPLYLTFILGFFPNMSIVFSGTLTIIGFVGVLWIIEPISYFPILGSSGTYMSFVSGNIGNMRIPAIGATQTALDLKAGSKKAEIAGIFALSSSVFINLVVLGIVVFVGQKIILILPASLLSAFDFAVPGVLGAMLVSFASKMKKQHLIFITGLGFFTLSMISKLAIVLPPNLATPLSIGKTGITALVTIIVGYNMAVRDNKKSNVTKKKTV